ncbi:MAG: histidinol-phosphate transaminase [Paramuribaculum sp.]|jgi:histidinol-phosphate aminotransferase
MNPIAFIRKNILALQPYSTARDDFKGGDISVWLDANESPYSNGVNRYPDPHQRKVKEQVAALFGAPAESIFLGGAGSDEAIDLVYRIFCTPGCDNAVAITPSYGVYRVAADINDIKLREIELDPGFGLPVDRILDSTDSLTKVIWLCSPNNPTGNAFERADMLRIADRFNGMVVIDEAYADFSSRGSMINDIATHPNIIILRTFSKAWGLAGMRCGMAFADPRVIAYFDRVKYPYNMSSLIQQELLRRIAEGTGNHIAETVAERNRVASALACAPCVDTVYPSEANFLLVKVSDPDRIYRLLTDNGVIVRNRSRLPMCDGSLRITIGTPDENTRLINLFSKFER